MKVFTPLPLPKEWLTTNVTLSYIIYSTLGQILDFSLVLNQFLKRVQIYFNENRNFLFLLTRALLWRSFTSYQDSNVLLT